MLQQYFVPHNKSRCNTYERYQDQGLKAKRCTGESVSRLPGCLIPKSLYWLPCRLPCWLRRKGGSYKAESRRSNVDDADDASGSLMPPATHQVIG